MDSSVGSLMRAAELGTPAAAEGLFTTLYNELHSLARRELARRGSSGSLGVTTLLHEDYIEMAQRNSEFLDRPRFMAYAARVMRGLIIDHARRRHALKRGGQFEITSIEADVIDVPDSRELTKIGEALDELAKTDPGLAEIVDWKFFCGFSFQEIGAMRGISECTAQRQWEKARIYLHRSIHHPLSP